MLVGLCLVIMWGTFFPLISEAITGTEASVGPPWFDRLTTPLALVLVLLTGHRADAGVAARHAVGAVARVRRCPWRVAGVALVVLLAFTDAADSSPSLLMFMLRRVRAVASWGRSSGAARRRGA